MLIITSYCVFSYMINLLAITFTWMLFDNVNKNISMVFMMSLFFVLSPVMWYLCCMLFMSEIEIYIDNKLRESH